MSIGELKSKESLLTSRRPGNFMGEMNTRRAYIYELKARESFETYLRHYSRAECHGNSIGELKARVTLKAW